MYQWSTRRLGGVLAAAVALGTVVALAPAATAAPAAAPGAAKAPAASAAGPERAKGNARQKTGPGIGAAFSGGRTGDITLDGRPDITARNQYTGHLNVYPHSGTYTVNPVTGASLNTYPTVQSTSYGWSTMTWIGVGYVTPDGAPDVLSRTADGRLLVYPHSGSMANYPVFMPPTLLGYGWTVNDLITLDDWNGDGYDDIVARRANSGDVYVYFHSGTFSGLSTYPTLELALTGAQNDVWQAFGDLTGDGVTDMVYKTNTGMLGLFDFMADPSPAPGLEGDDYVLGYNWQLVDETALTDVNNDGDTDVLGRSTYNTNLYVYPHRGTWDTANTTATLQAPVLVGYGWSVNDMIT